jgi:hypothetical protein
MATKIVRSGRRSAANGAEHEVNRESSRDEINAKYADIAIPDGYTEATSFGTSWDYFKQPVLVGTIDAAGVRMIDLTKDPRKPRYSLKVGIVDEDGVVLDVWDSATLTDWFRRVRPGDEVMVAFRGQDENKKGGADIKRLKGFFKGRNALPPLRDDASPEGWDGTWDFLHEDKPEVPVRHHATPIKRPVAKKIARPTARAK